jgi:hypothetical protein
MRAERHRSRPRLTIVSVDKFAYVARNPATTWR